MKLDGRMFDTAPASVAAMKTALNLGEADIANLTSDLALKAPLASPTFTGTPTLPTGSIATTQSALNNTTALATTAYTDAAAALKLAKASNLSDVASAATARVNLGIDSRTARGDANYTILATDRFVCINAAFTASRTFTYPAANSVNAGTALVVLDEIGTVNSTNTLTLARAGSDSINGLASLVMTQPNVGVYAVSDGTSKWTIATVDATELPSVPNSKLAQMPTLTLKGNVTGGTAVPVDLTAVQAKTLLAIASTDVSGLGTSATLASTSFTRTDVAQSPTATQQVQARINNNSASIDALAYLNLAINPFHTVSQQNGSSAVTGVGYVTDMNQVSSNGPVVSVQQVANPFPSYPAIPYGLKTLVTTAKASLAAGDYIFCGQPFEGQRMAKLGFGTSQAQPVVIGQMMRSNVNLTGYVGIENNAGNRVYLKQFTLIANTDTWVPLIFPGDTAGTWASDATMWGAMRVCFGTGSTFQGTAGSWQAANLLGASDTTNLGATLNNQVIMSGLIVLPALSSSLADAPGVNDIVRFQRHPDDELRACERYFQSIVTGFGAAFNFAGYGGAGTSFIVTQPLHTPMRIVGAPITTSGLVLVYANCSALILTPRRIDSYELTVTITATGSYQFYANAGAIYFNARM